MSILLLFTSATTDNVFLINIDLVYYTWVTDLLISFSIFLANPIQNFKSSGVNQMGEMLK
jgi:hypothetical protein